MIRPARREDIAQIIELCGLHAEYERAAYSPLGKAEKLEAALFSSSAELYAWVVDSGGTELLGYATAVVEFATWSARPFVYVDTLYLREHVRRHGLGRKLIETISRFAREINVHEIQWQTPRFNADGIAFYQHIGAVGLEKIRFTLPLD
jgi:GNAT superfamily N-acetyltransferase